VQLLKEVKNAVRLLKKQIYEGRSNHVAESIGFRL